MPSVMKHCAISKKRTRYEFRSLHKWIDSGVENLGVDHRSERHYFNLETKETIKRHWEDKRKGWGEKAVIEWLFHIALDNLETAYKMSLARSSYGPKTYKHIEITFNRNGYIDCRFR